MVKELTIVEKIGIAMCYFTISVVITISGVLFLAE